MSDDGVDFDALDRKDCKATSKCRGGNPSLLAINTCYAAHGDAMAGCGGGTSLTPTGASGAMCAGEVGEKLTCKMGFGCGTQ